MNFFKKVLLSLSGANKQRFKNLSEERRNAAKEIHVTMGVNIVLTGFLAFFLGMYFAKFMTSSYVVSILIGAAFASLIAVLERMIVDHSNSTKSTITKGIMAVFIGLILAIPAELSMNENRIDQIIEDQIYSTLEARENIPGLESKLDSLRRLVNKYGKIHTKASAEYRHEIEGSETGVAGLGPEAKAKGEKMIKAEDKLMMIESKFNHIRYILQNKRKQIYSVHKSLKKESNPGGLIVRFEALNQIKDESLVVYWTGWVIRCFMILLTLCPVIIKMCFKQEVDKTNQ